MDKGAYPDLASAPPSYEQATGPAASYGFTVPPQPAGPTYQNQTGSPRQTQPQSQPQPQPTYYHQQGATAPSVVIVQQQTILPIGPQSTFVTCPHCHMQKWTRIEYEPSAKTHLMAAILCVLGFWCCVCLPYCAGSCMNTNHYCGNCNHFLGTYGNGL